MNTRQAIELNMKVTKARKEFIRIVLDQDKGLDDDLDILSQEFTNEIRKYSSANKIQDVDTLNSRLPKVMLAFIIGYKTLLKENNFLAAQVQSKEQEELVMNKYGAVARLEPNITRFFTYTNVFPTLVDNTFLERKDIFTGIPIGKQINTVAKGSINVVRSILEVGIREGKSASQIAADISQYVKPFDKGKQISPFTWVRNRFGGGKVTAIERGEIPSGSFSSNAFRIARTEINNTYRLVVVDLHKGRAWQDGFDWNLSPSHPKEDQCDGWAEGSPYAAGNLPKGHGHCMCYVTVRLKPLSAFI